MNNSAVRWGLMLAVLLGFAWLVIKGSGAFHAQQSEISPTMAAANENIALAEVSATRFAEQDLNFEPILTAALWRLPTKESLNSWQLNQRQQVWQHTLATHRIRVKPITDLAALKQLPDKVLIISNASDLTQDHLVELHKLLRQGYKILFTGWIGAPDTKETIKQMKTLLGVDEVVSLPKEQSFFVTAGSRNRFNANTLPGARVDLATLSSVPAVRLGKKQLSTQPGGWYWSTWGLAPAAEVSTALVHQPVQSGELLWLAFHPDLMQQNAHSLAAGRALSADIADFMLDRVTIELAPWPRYFDSAAFLAMDTEHQFGNAIDVYGIAKQLQFPLTYFILGADAEAHRDLLPKLAETGEIASHSYRHDSYKNTRVEAQQQRLTHVRQNLQDLGYGEATGFRPPYEAYDENLLPLLAATGFDYMAGDTGLSSMGLRTLTLESGKKFYLIPRSFKDDHELLNAMELESSEKILQTLLPELKLAQNNQGLYYFSFHTQMIVSEKHLDVLKHLMSELKKDAIWLATGSELVQWWKLRDQIQLQTEWDTNSGSLTIKNLNQEALPPFSVYLYPPHSSQIKLANSSQQVKVGKDPKRTELLISELAGEGVITVNLVLHAE